MIDIATVEVLLVAGVNTRSENTMAASVDRSALRWISQDLGEGKMNGVNRGNWL